MAEEKQEAQKTLVAFVVGLLIGGILVWAFSGPSVDAPAVESENEETQRTLDEEDSEKEDNSSETIAEVATLRVGDGKIVVDDQEASNSIKLTSAVYPISEGWIGVREYENENLGYILGVVRFSESKGLVPAEVTLQRSTTPGKTYAVVIYSDNGDSTWNLATDVQLDSIFDTFVAK